jgi:transposase
MVGITIGDRHDKRGLHDRFGFGQECISGAWRGCGGSCCVPQAVAARASSEIFFADQPRCLVAMEACGSSHFWAREIGRLGHEVRMIPPAYVKPFVKRQKNDAADAEAICEAAQ